MIDRLPDPFETDITEAHNPETTDKPWLFKPGQSGNPGGRPSTPLTALLRGKNMTPIVHKLYELAVAGKMDAIQLIYDRIEGKVADKHLIQGVILHVGDDYAKRGLKAVEQELLEMKQYALPPGNKAEGVVADADR